MEKARRDAPQPGHGARQGEQMQSASLLRPEIDDDASPRGTVSSAGLREAQ